MNTTRTKFLAGVFAAASLAACDGLHAPSAEEIASRKMSDATARVRAIALRTAHSPLAVASTIEEEGGGSREVAKPMLAPAEAAGELRKVASEIESTGGGEAQRRAARDLASRVRRDALVLEVAEFERLAGERDRLEAEARRCEAVAKAIKPSDDAETGAAGDFGARAAQSLGDAIAKYEASVRREAENASEAARRSEEIEGEIVDLSKRASLLEAQMNEQLAAAAASDATAAKEHVDKARDLLNEAQGFRLRAAEKDRDLLGPRGDARISAAAIVGHEQVSGHMRSLAGDYEKSSEAESTRRRAAAQAASALEAEAASLRERRERLQKEEIAALAESMAAALEAKGDGPAEGVEGATDALLRARVTLLLAGAVANADVMGKVSGMLSAAHASVRELESAPARSVRASIEAFATSIGADLAAPPPPPPAGDSAASEASEAAPEGSEAPASEPAPQEGGSPEEPTADAPASGEPAPSEPGSDPAPEPGSDEPAPGGEPAPDEPAPPPAEPADPNEPNK